MSKSRSKVATSMQALHATVHDKEYAAGGILASLRLGNARSRLHVVSTDAAIEFFEGGTYIPFPVKVHAMVTEGAAQYPDAIHWVDDGAGFYVNRDSRNLMPLLLKYFKHGNYASLQRQLNMYGWKKQSCGPRKGAFYNSDFHQYLVPHDHIALIPRRPPPPPPSAVPVQKRHSPANSSKRLGSSSKKAGTKRKSTFTSAVAAKVNKNTKKAPFQLSNDLNDVVVCVKRAPPHSGFGRYDTAATTTKVPPQSQCAKTNADASTKKAPSKPRHRSTPASSIASLMAKASPVLNAVERTTSDYQEKWPPRFSTPTLIAGSTSCITSQSALWRTSDHYSITPRVQNPRGQSRALQHVEPSKRPDQMAMSAPQRGTTFDRKDGKHPAWISPSVPTGCVVRGDDMENGRIYSASSIPEYVEVTGPRRRAADNRPVWISPSMPSGSIHVGADENVPPFDCDARDVNLPRIHPQGLKIPMTPITTRKLPKDEEKDTAESIYGSPMIPTPLSLQRHESSSSFLDPFVGEMGNLSYALDIAFADEDVSGDNALHNNSRPIKCEPIEDNVDVTGRDASFYRSACASMEDSDGHAYDFASANHSSIMLCPSLATSCEPFGAGTVAGFPIPACWSPIQIVEI